MNNDFLIELGTAELPAKGLEKLAQSLATELQQALAKANLGFGEISYFASPRRLAVYIKQLQGKQEDRSLEKRGPAVTAAYDSDGKPTPACLGFARSCGIEVNDLERLTTDKGEWVVCNIQQPGKTLAELLPELLPKAIKNLPIPKPMRWGDKECQFIRPVYWVVALYGKEVIDLTLFDLASGRETYGHRFHHPEAITLKQASDYEQTLLDKGMVMASFTKRKQAIKSQCEDLAKEKQGTAIINDNLLDEVTGLVELPVALLGNFNPDFLSVPAEALISSMQSHQKCFPIVNAEKNLLPHFITVSNIQSQDAVNVIKGNERVIRARLADADFFFRQDLHQPLTERQEALKPIIFQAKLGSIFDKSQRIIELAQHIATVINANSLDTVKTAQLCKTDLVTDMVGEFPELQGIMGFHYAKHQGETQSVALGIKEHYLPRFAQDQLPTSLTGAAVGVADRIDTLTGIFSIGKAPTGTKDPFALRRAALSLLRIIIEKQLTIDLKDLLIRSVAAYGNKISDPQVADQVFEFILERLKTWYSDQGIASDSFAAVYALRPSQPLDFHQRLLAVQAFRKLPEAQALAAAHKRVNNILNKTSEKEQALLNTPVDLNQLQEPAEKALADSLQKEYQSVAESHKNGEYTQALCQLASLRNHVDKFFDDVHVMVDDAELQLNRLRLLNQLRDVFSQVADIGLLQD